MNIGRHEEIAFECKVGRKGRENEACVSSSACIFSWPATTAVPLGLVEVAIPGA